MYILLYSIIVFYYCLALPVSELKPHLEELLQSVKRWAFSGSGTAADVSPLAPDMAENWTMGGLNMAFHRAEINVSVHSCISTKSHRNKLKVRTNWWDMIGKQKGYVWLDIQNSIQWPSAFEGAGASALPSTSSAYMWNLLHIFSSACIFMYILLYSIVFYYCLTLPVSELKLHLEELLQSVKRWAFSGSGTAADVSPLAPDMKESWTRGGSMFQCIVASQQNHIETNWRCEQID